MQADGRLASPICDSGRHLGQYKLVEDVVAQERRHERKPCRIQVDRLLRLSRSPLIAIKQQSVDIKYE